MPSTKPWSELRDKIVADPIRRARMEEYGQAMEDVQALARLRAELGLPEYEVDDEHDQAPADVPGTMHQEDRYISALRSYVEAMGGRLELNAVFPDGTATLTPGRRWVVPQSDTEPVGAATPSRRRGSPAR